MAGETGECALWYWRHYSPRFLLFDTEADAAGQAWFISEEGEGFIAGVQFPDGRAVPVEDWQAYRDEERRQEELAARREAERAAEPPRATRQMKDPFEGRVFTVDADEPDWLGA